MAITASSISFGYYNGKDVVDKLAGITYDYVHGGVLPTSANIRNYSLTPNGGVVEMEQDIYTSDGLKPYNYCQYVIGGLTYYGYVTYEGAAGGIVSYRINVDAATTMFAAGAFDTNTYVEYSSAGDPLILDSRRILSPFPTRVLHNESSNSILTHIKNNNYDYPVVLNVCNPGSKSSLSKTNPSNNTSTVTSYIMSGRNFRLFLDTFRSQHANDQAKFSKCILNAYTLPVMLEDINGLSSWSTHGHIDLYSTTDNANISVAPDISVYPDFIVYYAYTGTNKLYITIPPITIPSTIRSQPLLSNTLYYEALCFGSFHIPISIIAKQDSASGYTIAARVELDVTGGKYITTPSINGAFYPDYTVIGTFPNSSLPFIHDTDLTNYGLQLATSIANFAGGMLGGMLSKNWIGMANSAVNAVTDIAGMAYNQAYSGGTIHGTIGSSIQGIQDRLLYQYEVYDYADSGFPGKYNYPDFNVRNIGTRETNTLTGYIKTRNCNCLSKGYSQDIVSSANSAFDAGVFLS